MDYIRKEKNFDKFMKLLSKTFYLREAYSKVLLFSTLISFFLSCSFLAMLNY